MPVEPILIAGIGNPGARYERTRHNIGHSIVDTLVGEQGRWGAHKKSGALHVSARFAEVPVHIAKTTCFMNESGIQIRPLADYFSIDPARIIIVHDELDLPFGVLRLKKGGGEGGHNGLRSISAHLQTKDYCRLRVGIDHPGNVNDVVSYVLGKFTASEQNQLSDVCIDAGRAIELFIREGLTKAQNQINTKS